MTTIKLAQCRMEVALFLSSGGTNTKQCGKPAELVHYVHMGNSEQEIYIDRTLLCREHSISYQSNFLYSTFIVGGLYLSLTRIYD